MYEACFDAGKLPNMKLAILSLQLVVLATTAVLGRQANCSSSNHLTVQTSTGTYTGLIDARFPKTRQFRAIPFAQPPVLSRRWLPPQKLKSTPSEHHYATRFPPSCPQFVTAVTSLWNQNLTKGNLIYNGGQNDSSGLVGEATSEDCLYLAVWTPTTAAPPPDAGLPVLFFMTGGGFVIGGVDIPWQLPTSWVERSQSHIVVTINYRLNIFGFPNARGLADGHQNLGILDQRAALEWVRDNIAVFGGDPDRITMWGQSAGSFAADYHAYAFHQDPIAQAYFLQSGTVFSTSPPQDPTHSNFSFVARHVGCEAPCGSDNDEDGAAELDCMRQVPFAQIVNFIGQYGDRGATPALSFNVIQDDRIVFVDYKARSEAGKIARAPVIISTTANEMSSLVPYPVHNLTAGPYQPPVTAADIAFGVCPTLNSTVYRNRMGAGVPVFRFQYAGTFPNLNHFKWLGAYHGSDLSITFGTYELLDGIAKTTRFEVEVSRSMQDHILAFVKDPFHGPQKTMGWKPLVASDPHGGDLIRFGADGKVAQHVDGVEVDGVCQGLREYNPFP
jgi:acetylcholinesterase